MKLLQRLLREPLLHFAVMGGLIFLVFGLIGGNQGSPDNMIVVIPERIDQLREEYRSAWKRPPTVAEMDALIEEHVREEVYYRDALALGLDRNDAVVRRRLRQKMEFLTDTGSYLRVPGEGELETYFTAHETTYRSAPHLAFEQIYLGPSPDSAKLTESLGVLMSMPATDPATLGESTFLPAELALSVPEAVDGVFGQGFFANLSGLPAGEWAGPVTSSYGVHLVRILESLPALTPPLSEIREAVLMDWRSARALEIRQQDYAHRRARFTVEVRRQKMAPVDNR